MNVRTTLFSFAILSVIVCTVQAQSGYRDKLQSKLDSLVAPHERSTGTKFGPRMEFNFKKAFIGVMQSDLELYTSDISRRDCKAGDTIYLTKVNVVGRATARAHFGDNEIYYNLKAKQLKEDVVISDSIEFWRIFDILSKVNPRKFGPTWNTLACSDRDDSSDTKKAEQAWINSKNSTFCFTLERNEDRVFLDFDLSLVYGNAFLGMGCADTKEQYLEFKFLDGTTLKKINTEYEYCSKMQFEITEELEQFSSGILEMTFGFTKKTTTIELTEKDSQYMIDIKLDCVITR